MGYNVQKLTAEELRGLIETLESDIANRPAPPEFEGDFSREMMEQALKQARARLDEITKVDL
jgi:ElaB/YqjD/DUF883 family membrane-anchored ribosome-binding protein